MSTGHPLSEQRRAKLRQKSRVRLAHHDLHSLVKTIAAHAFRVTGSGRKSMGAKYAAPGTIYRQEPRRGDSWQLTRALFSFKTGLSV